VHISGLKPTANFTAHKLTGFPSKEQKTVTATVTI